jgi:hypothetical protein
VLSSKQQPLKDSVCITMSSVWVQLYYKGEEKPVGEADPIEIDPVPKNVHALKMKVKENYSNKLKHTDAGELKVYASGTTVPIPENTASLMPGNNLSDYPTTDETPLIVIAPKPEQQNGKLRCYSRIHSCIICCSNMSYSDRISLLLFIRQPMDHQQIRSERVLPLFWLRTWARRCVN